MLATLAKVTCSLRQRHRLDQRVLDSRNEYRHHTLNHTLDILLAIAPCFFRTKPRAREFHCNVGFKPAICGDSAWRQATDDMWFEPFKQGQTIRLAPHCRFVALMPVVGLLLNHHRHLTSAKVRARLVALSSFLRSDANTQNVAHPALA